MSLTRILHYPVLTQRQRKETLLPLASLVVGYSIPSLPLPRNLSNEARYTINLVDFRTPNEEDQFIGSELFHSKMYLIDLLRLYRKWVDHPEHDMWFARGGVNHKTERHIPTRVEREPQPLGRPWRDW